MLVTLDEGLEESLSESLLRLMDTTNSFIPGGFSWADISSSGNSRTTYTSGALLKERISQDEGASFCLCLMLKGLSVSHAAYLVHGCERCPGLLSA